MPSGIPQKLMAEAQAHRHRAEHGPRCVCHRRAARSRRARDARSARGMAAAADDSNHRRQHRLPDRRAIDRPDPGVSHAAERGESAEGNAEDRRRRLGCGRTGRTARLRGNRPASCRPRSCRTRGPAAHFLGVSIDGSVNLARPGGRSGVLPAARVRAGLGRATAAILDRLFGRSRGAKFAAAGGAGGRIGTVRRPTERPPAHRGGNAGRAASAERNRSARGSSSTPPRVSWRRSLDDNWKQYLALPPEMYIPDQVPNPQVLQQAIARYEEVSRRPEYAASARPARVPGHAQGSVAVGGTAVRAEHAAAIPAAARVGRHRPTAGRQ